MQAQKDTPILASGRPSGPARSELCNKVGFFVVVVSAVSQPSTIKARTDLLCIRHLTCSKAVLCNLVTQICRLVVEVSQGGLVMRQGPPMPPLAFLQQTLAEANVAQAVVYSSRPDDVHPVSIYMHSREKRFNNSHTYL